jgi:hypothetical protein
MLFREKPISAITLATLATVAGATLCGWFNTFDAVPTETPARAATSSIVGRLLRLVRAPVGIA